MVNERGAIRLGDMHGPHQASADESMITVIDRNTREAIEIPMSDAWEYGADAARFVASELNIFVGHSVIPERITRSSETFHG